jgi:glutathionylspermidine synthase
VRTLAEETAAWGFEAYDRHWERVAHQGAQTALALDTRMFGWRYVSLNALLLTPAEVAEMRQLTVRFGRLLTWATQGVLDDPDWWSELAWPWPAIELARQEPPHPGDSVTLYGRFDWLQDERNDRWQLVEYNADTPSGGREVQGLDPPILRLHRQASAPPLRRLGAHLPRQLVDAIQTRVSQFEQAQRRPVGTIGVVSSHTWLEDMSQAWWLAGLLRQAGRTALVGDVADLAVHHGRVHLRGQPIDALYRFYPIERLYRRGIFAPLMEATIDGRLLLLNGLRGFLAQSKTILAWLWEHRTECSQADQLAIERHLPAAIPARAPDAWDRLPTSVVKHANGREGAEVAFGDVLMQKPEDWETRLLEGGYVVQERVMPAPVADVAINEIDRTLAVVAPRYACVGAFCIGGQFGGCYTRLDGPITTGRATFVPTLLGPPD